MSEQSSNGWMDALYDKTGENNITDALLAIAEGLKAVSYSIERLGTADAATPMGAIELLAKEVRDGCVEISRSLDEMRSGVVEAAEIAKGEDQ